MQLNERNWKEIRKLFKHEMSKGHYSIATVNRDGTPHVTPIGSLYLREDMSGFYFEELAGNLARNLKENSQVCVMAVHSGSWFWLKAIVRGRFDALPGIRLAGRAGKKRPASPDEIARLRKFIRPFKFFKGYDILWSRMNQVRDIEFHSCENINASDMTYRLD